MIVLGIETSCDETAASIVTIEREILSNIVFSQLAEHAIFGGVVPEIAARSHLDRLSGVIQAALDQAGIRLDDLHGVAATAGPGLIGGLLTGTVMAKAIAGAKGLPYIPINHLEGHALTPRLTDNLDFPYLLLLISGGHTQILLAEGVGRYRRWGTTLDDAAGECFDKSAKLMGLPFPGGPNLEQCAKNVGNIITARKKFPLPSPMKGRPNCDFSFSGLKTAMRQYTENMPLEDAPALAAAFQDTMADILADRCRYAMGRFLAHYSPPNPTLVVVGGVSANQTIRTRLESETEKKGLRLYAPPLFLCGDNAAMIAWAGLERLRLGLYDSYNTPARPRWPLDDTTPAHLGAGGKA